MERDEIQARFAEFAAQCSHLPLYSHLAQALSQDDEAADLLLAAGPGQRRPVMWLAAFHELVLSEPSLPAARFFPTVVGDDVAEGDPWPDVRAAALDHADRLRDVMAGHTVQTNEVNRSVYLGYALGQLGLDSLDLVELGCSAGLLLGVDRYSITLNGQQEIGSADSPVRCEGTLSGGTAHRLPQIRSRSGADLAPVDLQDAAAVRWLEACLWPDQPVRMRRFRAAVELNLQHPAPAVVAGDMIDALPGLLENTTGDTVVFSSWALTYVQRNRRDMAGVLAEASRGRSVLLLTAEPDGAIPGVPVVSTPHTVLAVQSWRDGVQQPARVLGTVHAHGEWISASSN